MKQSIINCCPKNTNDEVYVHQENYIAKLKEESGTASYSYDIWLKAKIDSTSNTRSKTCCFVVKFT